MANRPIIEPEPLAGPIIRQRDATAAVASSNNNAQSSPKTGYNPADHMTFEGADPWVETEDSIISSPKFQETMARLSNTDNGRKTLGVFKSALAVKNRKRTETFSQGVGGYAKWLTDFGNSDAEITAGQIRDTNRAEFYIKKYSEDPRVAAMFAPNEQGGDPSLLNAPPEVLGYRLVTAGVIKSRSEYDFFIKHGGNKNSINAGMSVADEIKEKFGENVKNAPDHISNLVQTLQSQNKGLDPNKPEDRQKFIEYRKYLEDTSPSLIDGAFKIADLIIGDLFKSGAGLASTFYDPQIEWAGDYIEPTGIKLERKQKFLAAIKAIQVAQENYSGEESPTKNFVPDSKLDLLLRTKGAEQLTEEDFKVIDPANYASEMPRLHREMINAFDVIKADGGISEDTEGLSTGLTIVSAGLNSVGQLFQMLHSTDPNSWSAEAESTVGGLYTYVTTKKSLEDSMITSAIGRFNEAIKFDAGLQHRLQHGYFGDKNYDPRAGVPLTTFVDPTLVLGKGAKLLKLLAKTTKADFGLFKKLEDAKRFKAIAGIENITKNKYAFDIHGNLSGDLQLQWKAAKDTLEKAAGKTLTDAEVITEITKGNVKIPDIKDPTSGKLVDFPSDGLDNIYDVIKRQVKNTESLRRQAANAIARGNKIVYTEATSRTLKYAREMLHEAQNKATQAYIDFMNGPEMQKWEASGYKGPQPVNPHLLTNINWDNVSDAKVYQAIREGKVDFHPIEHFPVSDLGTVSLTKTPLTKSSWARMVFEAQREVGNQWLKLDLTDLAGFERAGAIPFELKYTTLNKIGQGLGWGSGHVKNWLSWWDESVTANLPKGVEPGAFIAGGRTETSAVQIATVKSEQNMFKTVTKIAQIKNLLHLTSAALDTGEFLADFFAADGKISMFQSTGLGMYYNYGKRLQELSKIKTQIVGVIEKEKLIAELTARGQSTKHIIIDELDKQVHRAWVTGTEDSLKKAGVAGKGGVEGALKRIDDEVAKLQVKMVCSKYVHAWTAAGVLSAVDWGTGLITQGLMNEAIAHIGTSQSGTGIGGAVMFGSMDKSIDWIRTNGSRQATLRERTNKDIYEIVTRLDGMDPVQQMNFVKLIKRAKDEGQAMGNERIPEVGDAHTARMIASLLYTLKATSGNVEIHDKHVNMGIMRIMQSTTYFDPAMQAELVNKLIEQSNKLGLTGDEALNYAQKLIDNGRESVLSGNRIGKIAEEIELLTGQKQKLTNETNKDLYKYEQGVREVASRLGIDITKFHIDENNNITVAGKPLPPLQQKQLDQITTLTKEYARVRDQRIANNIAINGVNEKIANLEQERIDHQRVSRVVDYRPGEMVHNPQTNTTAQNWGGGVTLLEQNGKTRVLFDDKVDISTLYEELNHALFYTDAMKTIKPQILASLFGKHELNQAGQWVQTQAPFVDIALVDKFVDVYASGLDKDAAVMFKAQYEVGKKQFATNPADFRNLEPAIMEIFAAMYKGRMATLDPHMGRSDQFGSSYKGSIEQSPIIVGKGPGEIFRKLTTGSLTVNELVRHFTGQERAANMAELSRMTPAQQATYAETIAGATKLLAVFGAGGLYDLMFKANRVQALKEMGLIPRGNQSADPARFWETGKLYDYESGKMIEIDPRFQHIVDSMINITRNVAHTKDMNAIASSFTIFSNIGDNSDAAKAQRVSWAMATGNTHWLEKGPDGKFNGNLVGPIPELIYKDNAATATLFNRIIDGGTGRGDGVTPSDLFFGFNLTDDVKGGNKKMLVGVADKRQLNRLVNYITDLQGNFNQNAMTEMNNLITFMTAIADSNPFDPEATTQGTTRTFIGEYAGNTEQLFIDSTEKSKANGARLRVFTPVQIFVRDTKTDVHGNTLQTPVKVAYAYVIDEQQRIQRIDDAYKGLLVDKNNVPFFKKGEVRKYFGSPENFAKCMDLVLVNYAKGGSPVKSNPNHFIPERSWEVLLSEAGGNPTVAKHMADIVNRVIGVPGKNYFEMLDLADQEVKGTLTEEGLNRLEQLRKNPPTAQAGDRSFGALQDRANPIGERAMMSQNNIWTMIRLDRFQGEVVPSGKSVPWTQYSNGYASINFSANTWKPVEMHTEAGQGVLKNIPIVSGKNTIIQGVITHELTGMNIVQLSKNKGKNTSFMIYDSNNKLIFDGSGIANGGITSFDEAIKHAETYAANKIQRTDFNNPIEKTLHEHGFVPVGIAQNGPARNTFASSDGKYILTSIPNGAQNTKYTLLDNVSGVPLVDDIHIGFDIANQPDISNVKAALIMAETGNFVNFKIEESRIEGLNQEWVNGHGLAEWTPIIRPDGRKQPKGIMFARSNPVYYDFKRKLIASTGHANALKILEKMKQELGADAIENDFSAITKDNTGQATSTGVTIKWIQDFVGKHHWDIEQMSKNAFADIKADEAITRASLLVADGTVIPAHQPETNALKRGKNDPLVTVTSKPENPISKGDIDVETSTAFDVATRDRAKEIAQQREKQQQDIGSAHEELTKLLEWAKTLQNLQSHYNEQASKIPKIITSGESPNPIIQQMVANKLDQMGMHQNSIVGAWVAGTGHTIVQAMFPKNKSLWGFKIRMKNIEFNTPSKKKALGPDGKFTDLLPVPKLNQSYAIFYVFTPSGVIVGQARTMQEAQTLAAEEEKRNKKLTEEIISEVNPPQNRPQAPTPPRARSQR